jgi:hypothetical protein
VNDGVHKSSSYLANIAATVEYLLPRESYKLKVETENLGISVSQDMHVASLSREPGLLAERSGRVHVGDRITSVNDQDIVGISAPDAVPMINCKRPTILGFSVAPPDMAARLHNTGMTPSHGALANQVEALANQVTNQVKGKSFLSIFGQKPTTSPTNLDLQSTSARGKDTMDI